MNKNAQLDLHPNAESLNAFAEQALVGREREEIVTHLAVCSRCRQVVFLAQDAAAVLEPAIAAAAVRAPARREPWYTNWRFAWVPLGAMAMVVTLAYVVHLRRAETRGEMAQFVTQAPPQIEIRESQPAAPSAQMQQSPKAPAAGAAEQKQRVLKAKAQTEEAEQLALAAPAAAAPGPVAPPPQAPTAGARAGESEPADGGNNKTAQAQSAPGSSLQAMGALAQYRQEQANAGLKKEDERGKAAGEMHGLAARNAEKANADDAAKQAETDQLTPASAAAAASEQVEVSPAPAVGRGAGGGRATSGAFAVYKAKAAGLPSGLAAVSMAVAQHSLLAVDKAGSVFLSEDAGSHWESVGRQWNGRAVAVRTKAAAEANAAGVEGSAQSAKAGFELVNDQGQVWTSSDGRTWKIQ